MPPYAHQGLPVSLTVLKRKARGAGRPFNDVANLRLPRRWKVVNRPVPPELQEVTVGL